MSDSQARQFPLNSLAATAPFLFGYRVGMALAERANDDDFPVAAVNDAQREGALGLEAQRRGEAFDDLYRDDGGESGGA